MLTGKYYFRKRFNGLVLMVEYEKTVCDFVGDESPPRKLWRKAKQEDITNTILKLC